jgi:hypothetical protein
MPCIFRKCGLGAQNAYQNPVDMLLLPLFLEPITTAHSDVQHPTLSPKLYHNQTGVIIVEVKYLRQTVAIEMVTGKQMPHWNESNIPSAL